MIPTIDEAKSGGTALRRQLVGPASLLLPWLEDSLVTDVLVNGMTGLFVDRGDGLERYPCPFPSAEGLRDAIERLAVATGRPIDAAQPFLDGRLADGSRFHVVLPPLAPEGPLVSIRRGGEGARAWQPPAPLSLLEWLRRGVRERANLVLSGGTGAGKTRFLGWLLEAVPEGERVVVLEETREIESRHPHLVRLEARPASPDGRGEVTLRSLLRNALRMRPDRIVLGECRGAEALDMLQALNTGHAGSLTTLHASGARDALSRLEAMALLASAAVPLPALREWIGASVQLVVHLERDGGGRHVAEVLAVCGTEGDRYRLFPVYEREAGRRRRPWPPEAPAAWSGRSP